MQHLRRLFL